VNGTTTLGAVVGLALMLLAAASAQAEPYIAVQSGFKCSTCHTNPSGGGKRTVFGNAYAASTLSGSSWSPLGEEGEHWTGEINRWFALGGDLRAALDYVETPGQEEQSSFDVSRGTIYAEFRVVPDRLTFYVDEQFAPGGAINREVYALLAAGGGRYTVKAGKFFLPFGLRLQDDSAFVRRYSGINFDTPDQGIELGLELDRWSAQVAVTNGTSGAPDDDTTKQTSVSATYIDAGWRLGVSYNLNNAALGDREMLGVFAGLRTGPIAWLAEIDAITDDVADGQQDALAGLLEANWRVAAGHNVKLSYEHYDPNDAVDEDDQQRLSLVWEYWAFQHFQSRVGLRTNDGVAAMPLTDQDEFFAELHVYF
jgi:hypothetical protein